MNDDFQSILDEIATEVRPLLAQGKVADYIPALAAIPSDRFAMAVWRQDGAEFAVGEAERRFSVQSISEVFALALALRAAGSALWRRVGCEPSGNPFNSLVQLEYENGIPRNPFINAGALVVIDCLMEAFPDARAALLEFARDASGSADIEFDPEVAASEASWGYRNRALANFL